jgi:hypothetical protein
MCYCARKKGIKCLFNRNNIRNKNNNNNYDDDDDDYDNLFNSNTINYLNVSHLLFEIFVIHSFLVRSFIFYL